MESVTLLNLVYMRKMIEPALTLAQAFAKVKTEIVIAQSKIDVVQELLNDGTPEVTMHDAVNDYLVKLEKENPGEFEKMRRKTFAEQQAAAGM